MNPRYPVYIVSKGRWESRLTARTLATMGVPFFIVVEEQERPMYEAAITGGTILTLDPEYQRTYDTYDDLGDAKSKGPGPARNFAWDHAISLGHDSHWVMDDNIRDFYRFHRNQKIRVIDGTCLRAMEDFCDRYENVAMAGPHYQYFVAQRTKYPPFTPNTRIYSCNLIRNHLPYRWRGRYNEDTDLSLRMLKDGWCTIQFYAFLSGKITTQVMTGGNTDEFYAKEGTLEKSRMLVRMHPDVTRLVWKYNRWHHHVDYRPFANNQLRRRPDAVIPDAPNEYGMALKEVGREAIRPEGIW